MTVKKKRIRAPLTAEQREQRHAIDRTYRTRHPEKQMVRQARKRAKKLGVPFDLVAEAIIIPTHCPVDGLPLESGVGKGNGFNVWRVPSLDRKVPSEGYTKANTEVISLFWNTRKRDMTAEDMRTLLRYMEGPTGDVFPAHCALSFGA